MKLDEKGAKDDRKWEQFLIEDGGIENILKFLTWLTSSSGLFWLSLKLTTGVKVYTLLFSILLFVLTFIWGIKKVIIPLLETISENKEKYLKMKNMRLVDLLKQRDFWIYIMVTFIFCYLTLKLFDELGKSTLKSGG